MKKLCFILSAIICLTAAIGWFPASAAAADDKILTLEEAKALALENDVQYNLQQGYIQNASESYEEVYDNNSSSDKSNYSNIAERAKAEVSRKMSIEKAASSVRKAVFARNDLKRESDYSVTVAYYGALNALLGQENAELEKALSQKKLETAKIKYSLQLIKKSELADAEKAYDTAVYECDNAFKEVQKSFVELSNSIGKNLDIYNDKLDMTVTIPDISSLDMNKIKEDYMKNNSGFYSAKETYDLAEYQLQLTEDKFDYYYKRLPNRTTALEDKLKDMLEDAQREFDDAKYSYVQKENELDATLNNQYISINKSLASYEELLKDLEEEKQTLETDRIKYQMRLVTKTDLESDEAALGKLENQIQAAIADLIVEYAGMTQYSISE